MYAERRRLRYTRNARLMQTEASHGALALPTAALTVQVAQVTIPAERDGIHDEHAMLERDILEVERLHPRPEQPVLLERGDVCALEARRGARALEVRHAAQEQRHVGARKHGLVEPDLCRNLEVRPRGHLDVLLQEAEPQRCAGTENACGR